MKTEVVNAPLREELDTTFTRTKTDTTDNRHPIGFGVTLEEWINYEGD